MPYVIGVSSGMFMAAEAAEKLQYITVSQKAFYGAFKGSNFTQIDIESITEFKEPYLEEEIKKIKSLGIEFGVHGESYAMGGTEKPISMLDSAIETEYIHAHQRLLQHIEGCGKIGAKYVNIHPSETTPFIRLGMHLQPSKLVDPFGRPFNRFLEENPKLVEWVVKQDFIMKMRHVRGSIHESYNQLITQFKNEKNREPTKEEEAVMIQKAYREGLKEFTISNDLEYGAEMVAYFIVAKWMQMEKDPIWMNIVGKTISDEDLLKLSMETTEKSWIPAVSAKYIWGHFNPKDARFADPKSLLEKYKVYFIFETQMGGGGLEGLFRLVRPRDMILLCKAVNSKWVGVCFDFEHVLGQNIDPKKEIETIPSGDAKFIKVCHVGWPTGHAPAHVPIPLGSKQQLYVYERLYELRQKGFEDGYLIFERGSPIGGRDPIQESVIVLRLIRDFLEKDTLPKELPEEFFGLKPGGPDIKRQELAIKEHFLDPLKGTLSVPEEEYSFLSTEALKRKRPEEWAKERYR